MLEEELAALQAGLVVGVPTDTVYGLAADPWRRDALERLFRLKGRPAERPVALLVASLDQARSLGGLFALAESLAARWWPGPLTLVVPRRGSLPKWLGDPKRRSIGLRMPDHPEALRLLEAAGPLAVTSANRSGETAVLSDEEARALFGNEVRAYLPGKASGGEASTVLDLTVTPPHVVRRGPVSI